MLKKYKIPIIVLYLFVLVFAMSSCNKTTEYTVTFNSNYGENQITTKTFKENATIEFPIQNRDGYKLIGWSYELISETFVSKTLKVTSDLTLYAQWEKLPETYMLEFDVLDDSASISATEGEVVTLPECTITIPGKEFSHWDIAGVAYPANSQYTMTTENLQAEAKFIDLLKVEFVLDGGTGTIPTVQYYHQNDKFELPTSDGFANEEYEFLGWYDGMVVYQPGEEYIIKTTGVTFTACWNKDYTLIFDYDNSQVENETFEYLSGTAVKLPVAPSKDNYVFYRWFDGKSYYDEGSEYIMPCHDVTITAVYDPGYLIQLVYNHYGKETDVYQEYVVLEGSKLPNIPAPSYQDHNFIGWYTDADCEYEWNMNSTVRSTVVLYAKWESAVWVFNKVENGTAYEIVSKRKNYVYDGEIYLPATYEGLPVIGIADAPGNSSGALYMLNRYVDENKVTAIYIPKGYKYLGDWAINANYTLETVVFEEGSECERLGHGAFYNNKLVDEYVNLPSSISSIGAECFLYNQSLATVDLSANTNLKVIDEWTFGRCYALSEILLPTSIEEIREAAFVSCLSLTEFTFPENVTRISEFVLSASNVPLNPSISTLRSDQYALFPSDVYNDVVMKLETINIGKNVEEIASFAFSYTKSIKNIVFDPETELKTIGNYAFYHCDGLEAFTVSNTVTSIGEYAFHSCISLSSFVFEENSKIDRLSYFMLAYCKSLTTLELPSSVELIGACSLGATGLVDFVIPTTVKAIGNYAFAECMVLESVTIPASLEEWGTGIFYGCPTLLNVNWAEGFTLSMLPDMTFYYCTGMVELNLPASISSFGIGVLEYTSSLEKINASLESETLASVDGVLFSKNLQILHFYPAGKKVDSYTIPSGTREIGMVAFQRANNLKNVYIPSTVTKVGQGSFRYMNSIEKIEFLPNSNVNDIRSWAFGNSTKYVDDTWGGMIESCTFKTFVITAIVPPTIYAKIFVYSTEHQDFKIYVPAESVEAYKIAPNWSEYANYIYAISND